MKKGIKSVNHKILDKEDKEMLSKQDFNKLDKNLKKEELSIKKLLKSFIKKKKSKK